MMQEVLDFLGECGTFFLATDDDGQPRVRPLGFVMAYDGKLCYCTNNAKPKFKQMQKNPKVEISGCVGPKWVRITGKAAFNTSAESQKAALEAMPSLGNMYAVGDGKFEIFYLDGAVANFASMTGESKTVTL